ncbi:MAG: glycerophosphodiester phosphodiesterase family protein [Gammaproteobacteria bacterium]|nr:glycerophosphodiester phosphodiesterase family protein [Gammaproteobacteria bacterium]MDH3750252.1 glycerophosphodiester phosphodiesterase family protein [Gammaproteobacteria bacterium]MDH3805039.1 glycerophosphodiester phosphodiesterase family protein [Gammaproteobacteria bacterium]
MTGYLHGSSRRAAGVGAVCCILLATAWGSQWPDWTVLNIAHRGGIEPGYAENTLAAYRRAISFGVDVIEIDLRGTRDGEVIVLHDETLDRTTDGTGKVTDYTLAELKRLNAGSGESIPTYAEVLDLVAGTGVKLLLDIKVSPVLDKRKVVRLTEGHDAVLDVIVGVRTLDDLRQFRRLNPNIRTLGFIRRTEDIDDFVAGGIDIIRLWPEWIRADQEIVTQVHELGKPVWTTAGDAPREVLEELIGSGVNGILSDFPEVTSRVMADFEARRRGAQQH